MKIFSAHQVRDWDRYTIDNKPISSIDLIELAAGVVVDELLQSGYAGKTCYIFCGPGNNGGDGLAIARLLHHLQRPVNVFLLESQSYSVDCGTNLQRAREAGIYVKEIDGAEEFPIMAAEVVIIDALFGSGLNRGLGGLSSMLVRHINQHRGIIISIDLPSGMFADSSSVGNMIVKASTTLSFESPKLAFLMAENGPYTGDWKLLPIGLSRQYSEQVEANAELVDASLVRSLVRPKQKFSHKYNYGHALLYAGSPGMYGAGILCAKACLRSGVGLASIAIETQHLLIYQTTLPEAICITDWTAETVLTKKTAIGIGPGWAATDDYMHVTEQVYNQCKLPAVIDASALRLLSEISVQKKLTPGTIITPHTGEFEHCFGVCNNDFDRYQLALSKSKELHIYIVLKGAHTLVATPEGKAFFNSTGNAGMAKGGSGDLLTGLLTGLLAQGYSPLHTCIIGVYLHGLAGDIAAAAHTQYAMTAIDIVDKFGEAWKLLTE
ncbi:MAG: NAD(P)H-hydrate dehydratase [Chitinophagaceae bacterium]